MVASLGSPYLDTIRGLKAPDPRPCSDYPMYGMSSFFMIPQDTSPWSL